MKIFSQTGTVTGNGITANDSIKYQVQFHNFSFHFHTSTKKSRSLVKIWLNQPNILLD